jgi:hypothetical protein
MKMHIELLYCLNTFLQKTIATHPFEDSKALESELALVPIEQIGVATLAYSR